jgi:Subtilase family
MGASKKLRAFAALGALMLLLGCVSSTPAPGASAVKLQSAHARPTVVALIDSGINPYHDVFADRNATTNFSSIAPNVTIEKLSMSGTYEQRVEVDSKIWNNIQPTRLYGFEGTRVMAIDFSDRPTDKILDDVDHGSGTASLVARDDPTAIVVMIQADGGLCLNSTPCPMNPTIIQAMKWASAQPWIDVISLSAAVPGDIYDPSTVSPESKVFLEAARTATSAGKFVIIGSGNTVLPSLTSYMVGPPWIICVGGLVVQTRGQGLDQNNFVDVVANYTEQVAANNDTSATRWVTGTSMATPIVAATLGKAISELRSLVGQTTGIQDGAFVTGTTPDGRALRVTNSDLRAALNASARDWNATDWNPTNGPSPDPLYNAQVTTNLPILLAPVQMGWGYVNSTFSDEIAHRVLVGDFGGQSPEKVAYMGEYAALRQSLWQ